MYIPKSAELTVSALQTAKYNVFTETGVLFQGSVSAAGSSVMLARRSTSTTLPLVVIYNDSGLSNTVTVRLNQTAAIVVFKATLAIGESAVRSNGEWRVYTTVGEIK